MSDQPADIISTDATLLEGLLSHLMTWVTDGLGDRLGFLRTDFAPLQPPSLEAHTRDLKKMCEISVWVLSLVGRESNNQPRVTIRAAEATNILDELVDNLRSSGSMDPAARYKLLVASTTSTLEQLIAIQESN